MVLLDGKKLSHVMRQGIRLEVDGLSTLGVIPKLAVFLVGDDRASRIYVKAKTVACSSVGVSFSVHEMPGDVSQAELVDSISAINFDRDVDGVLVQLPLPLHIDKRAVLESILPSKDVDGLHSVSNGRLHVGMHGFVPATPLGVITLLNHYGIPLAGKDVAVVGASDIVGRPLAALMLNAGATVSICHSLTSDVSFYTRRADIVCVAIGKARSVTRDMIKPGAVVVDIGINRCGDNGLVIGDVDFESVSEICSYITPVPGGVGPMTITSLLQNTVDAAKARLEAQS